MSPETRKSGILRVLLCDAPIHGQLKLVIAGADRKGPDRTVERHALKRLHKHVLVHLPRFLEPLGDELGRHVAVERADPGIPVVCLPELLDECPVRRRIGVVEEIVRRPEDAFGRIEALRHEGRMLVGRVLIKRYLLAEAHCFRRLLEIDHARAARRHYQEIGLCRQDLRDIRREVRLTHLPPCLAHELHAGFQSLQVVPDAVRDVMAVFIVVAGYPVFHVGLFRQDDSSRLPAISVFSFMLNT